MQKQILDADDTNKSKLLEVSQTILSQTGELKLEFTKEIFALPFSSRHLSEGLQMENEIDIEEVVKVEVVDDDSKDGSGG